ncbi:uroporphyrinogen-III C-methyltransferase [Aliikangiella sp. G2MR2-5]|uniref:uroporphyrinogen-III C-methyltransferase n=1 Tax=Aliikangiella sp. G2MR2-5 TaxID=2788943 RepID=UPI0018A97D7B|nr:uroporphyrinogen-III C-methyltransferase [Aliikangiella sp. G2MR2-5]
MSDEKKDKDKLSTDQNSNKKGANGQKKASDSTMPDSKSSKNSKLKKTEALSQLSSTSTKIEEEAVTADKNAANIAPEDSKAESRAPTFNKMAAPKLDKPKKARNQRGPLAPVAIILSIIALIAIGWASYNQYLINKQWKDFQEESSRQSIANGEMSQDARRLAELSREQVTTNQQVINQQTQLITQLKQALTATQQRVRELSGRQQQDWLLAEAEYLIKLAEYKISLEKDKDTAIGLLKTADERLIKIADTSLIELRQVIAQDIANLQLVVSPDIEGIAVRLQAIASQIEALNLKALEFEKAEQVDQTSDTKEGESFSWNKIYQNFLDDFVTIKDHSEPVRPLMTPEQRGNLNANILLALQQAQIALVRGEGELFRNNLQRASHWIDEFFVANETAQTVQNNIDEIMKARVAMDLPRQLDSKKAIQIINQKRLYHWLEQQPGSTQSELDEVLSGETQEKSEESQL